MNEQNKKYKLLFVDDEVDILELCVMYLQRKGFEVVGAKKSAPAFEQLENFKPEILITDLDLKEKHNGFDVIKKGFALNPKLRVAVLTGRTDNQLEPECNNAGAHLILLKPLTLEALLEGANKLASEVAGTQACP